MVNNKLNKNERNEIYKGMMEIILNDFDYQSMEILNAGLCFTLKAYIRSIYCLRDISLYKSLPELFNQKPKRNFSRHYWWNPHTKEGTTKRIIALLTAISETEKK